MDHLHTPQALIEKVKSLPTLPGIVHKVLALVHSEDVSTHTLGNLISYDQAITSRLLKVANSAYYGLMREIATVQHAIVVLGFKEVKSLTLGITVFNAFKTTNHETFLSREAFWTHSIGTALAGQLISKKVPGIDAEAIFTSALLHDIGKLVLDSFFSSEYEKVLLKVKTNNVSMSEAERTLIGCTHAEVGGLLAERWKFPLTLVYPITFHHHPEKVEKKYLPMTSIVHLADVICRRAQIGSSGDTATPSPHPLALTLLKLGMPDLDHLIEELSREQEKVFSFLRAIQ